MAKGNIPVGLFYASYPKDCTYKLNSSSFSLLKPFFPSTSFLFPFTFILIVW